MKLGGGLGIVGGAVLVMGERKGRKWGGGTRNTRTGKGGARERGEEGGYRRI